MDQMNQAQKAALTYQGDSYNGSGGQYDQQQTTQIGDYLMNARETLGKKKDYIRQLQQEKERLMQRNGELRSMNMSKSNRF
jgi:tRNA(Leu) C34 or U34 (ribose-2'-O)-methylase TrmL